MNIDYSQLTIGIVVYDEIGRIKQLVQSFHYFHSPNSAQWVFVLNHQDKVLRNLIKAYLYQLIPQAVCIENKSNNIAVARNLILQNSKTNWVYFTDPDIDQSLHNLNLLFRRAGQKSDFGIIGFGGPVYYKSTDFFIQKTYDFFSDVMKYLPFSFLIQNHQLEKRVDHVPTCHMLIDRLTALKIGAFNTNYRLYGEDLEFTHRLSNQRLNFLFIPNAEVYHWQNLTFTQHLNKMFRWGQVQINSNYDNWKNGMRWYRLFPLFVAWVIVFGFVLFPFISFYLTLLLSGLFLVFPGFAGATLSFIAYALGELSQVFFLIFYLRRKKNNALLHQEVDLSKTIKNSLY